ncbi:glutamine synthetase family protein [Umezawaea tangerina]|uniref:L-glutamine synthetase n=1 Tax=Umezawaea tangerina TaxID=84725 RepID=A0A2T0SZM4_9PSEU|nr:glutamine synthetase family protein [Umezawaea tangerina]PRY38866.1 L-glutamine synthetase [Umezawaea tangerina]
MNSDSYLAQAAGQTDFVARHGLWDDEQKAAATEVEARLDSVDFVRVVYGDPHGIARSKTVSTEVFRTVLRNGMDFSPGPFVFDTGHAVAVDFFAEGGGIGIPELTGAGDFIVVPDPRTFRVLPHTGRPTGWVIGDEHLRDGSPHPLSGRAVLKRQCDQLAARGLSYVVGLEVEWYLTKKTGDPLARPGGFGVQGGPPAVEHVNGGYQFNSDSLLDAVMPVIDPVIDALLALGLPIRTVEHESGPGQLEFTFSPMDGLDAADAMLLFRTVTKQVLARGGHHASFMALPGLPGFDPSGWHLHQSLADRATGRNLFVAEPGADVLSELGMAYLGGLLEHAPAASLLCVPTINGYRRMRTGFSLSPDRIAWSTENRGAFLRVLGANGDPGSHVENRIGEPSANPYLYLASQVSAGVDGVDNQLKPGPPAGDPHSPEALPLPTTLVEALEGFTASDHYRVTLGGALHEALRLMKTSEQARYDEWRTGGGAVRDDEVTEWEHSEYFATY